MKRNPDPDLLRSTLFTTAIEGITIRTAIFERNRQDAEFIKENICQVNNKWI